MRILVTGAAGMLGHDVRRVGERAGHDLILVDLPELDITDEQAVLAFYERERPDATINCAAWTDVDGAESNREAAHAVNAEGAGNLARAAAAHRRPLLHISTDYVFDGTAAARRRRSATALSRVRPDRPTLGLRRDQARRGAPGAGASPAHTVVRTAWLYGIDGPNFVATMLRLAGEREAVQVVDDQIGSPTWSGHLAPAVIGLLEREVSGLVHLTGAGSVSWNGFAKEIFRQAELDCRVEAVHRADGPPAPRPAFSVLETEREDVLPMPDWRDGLAGYLAAPRDRAS